MSRLRIWLIRRLAGQRIIAINVRIIDGGIVVRKTDPPALIDWCTIVRAKDTALYIETGSALPHGFGLTVWRGPGEPA